MKPGQILFYQSAKLVHGRPKPFAGDRFVNCFCHFKPAVRPGQERAPAVATQAAAGLDSSLVRRRPSLARVDEPHFFV